MMQLERITHQTILTPEVAQTAIIASALGQWFAPETLAQTRANVMLIGASGVGKSYFVASLAKYWNIPLVKLTSSSVNPNILFGFPKPDDGVVRLLPPAELLELVKAPKSFLFLDELNNGTDLQVAATVYATQDGRIGEFMLPLSSFTVAAINPGEIATMGNDLRLPIANRFTIIPYKPTAEFLSKFYNEIVYGGQQDEYIKPLVPVPQLPEEFTVRKEVFADIVSLGAAFIEHAPDRLALTADEQMRQYCADENDPFRYAIATPRTVNRTLLQLVGFAIYEELCNQQGVAYNEETVGFAKALVAFANLGTGAGGEFIRFMAVTQSIPSVDEFLKSKPELSTEQIWRFISKLAYSVDNEKSWNKAWEVVNVLFNSGKYTNGKTFGTVLARKLYEVGARMRFPLPYQKIKEWGLISSLGQLLSSR